MRRRRGVVLVCVEVEAPQLRPSRVSRSPAPHLAGGLPAEVAKLPRQHRAADLLNGQPLCSEMLSDVRDRQTGAASGKFECALKRGQRINHLLSFTLDATGRKG